MTKYQRFIKNLKQALKLDEQKLSTLRVGSGEWCNLYEQIEFGKELLK